MQKRRRSLRLPEYDYSTPGAYFVTICTRDRLCVFGQISDACMALSPPGKIAEACLKAIPQHFPAVTLDHSVVMPNHVHAVLFIGRQVEPHAAQERSSAAQLRGQGAAGPALGSIIRSYKSAVSIGTNRAAPLAGPLWQPNYYEHVVRGEGDLRRIQEYILANPAQWELDEENPQAFKPQSPS